VREVGGRPELTSGPVHALGGTLSGAPHQPASGNLVLDARDLSLPKLLDVARESVVATGVLDGTLEIAAGERGCSLRRMSLWARESGVLRVRDRALRETWAAAARARISARVQGALADFAYTGLSLMVAPPNEANEVRLELRGRGRQVPQSLDLVINLHGVRAAVDKLVARMSHKEPS
jgi:hypothetical protein